MDLTFSVEEINKFLALNSKKAARVLSDLGKLIPFIEACYSSEFGKELLKDDIQRFTELHGKVMDLEATDDEKAEYRYLKTSGFPVWPTGCMSSSPRPRS